MKGSKKQEDDVISVNKELIYILEDEEDISLLIKHNLEKEGYQISCFSHPESFLHAFKTQKPNLIVLDLMLPGMNGLEILGMMRSSDETRTIPVIIMTARNTEGDRVLGLDLGADDYVTKPFSVREFVARVKAVLRRAHKQTAPKGEASIMLGGLKLDTESYQLFVDDHKVEVTKTEFMLLKALLSNPDKVYKREEILDKLWGNEKFVIDRTVDVHVKRLRDKLGKYGKHLKTVRGIGYVFDRDEK